MSEAKHTPGPWEMPEGPMAKSERLGQPKKWRYVQHHFPSAPYEGELNDEWGIYPPLGEAGPVALVAGEGNARLIAAAPDLLAACEAALKAIVRTGDPFCGEQWESVQKLRAAIAKAKGATV